MKLLQVLTFQMSEFAELIDWVSGIEAAQNRGDSLVLDSRTQATRISWRGSHCLPLQGIFYPQENNVLRQYGN